MEQPRAPGFGVRGHGGGCSFSGASRGCGRASCGVARHAGCHRGEHGRTWSGRARRGARGCRGAVAADGASAVRCASRSAPVGGLGCGPMRAGCGYGRFRGVASALGDRSRSGGAGRRGERVRPDRPGRGGTPVRGRSGRVGAFAGARGGAPGRRGHGPSLGRRTGGGRSGVGAAATAHRGQPLGTGAVVGTGRRPVRARQRGRGDRGRRRGAGTCGGGHARRCVDPRLGSSPRRPGRPSRSPCAPEARRADWCPRCCLCWTPRPPPETFSRR